MCDASGKRKVVIPARGVADEGTTISLDAFEVLEEEELPFFPLVGLLAGNATVESLLLFSPDSCCWSAKFHWFICSLSSILGRLYKIKEMAWIVFPT